MHLPRIPFHIGARTISVEVASTWLAKVRGLSGRRLMDEDAGMLFVFPRPRKHLFWMFGMKFPLDVVFLNGDRVVFVASNIPHPQGWRFPAIISCETPADRVLEINAGKAKEWGLEVNESVSQ